MNLENLVPINQKKLYGHINDLTNIIELYNNKKLPNKIFFFWSKRDWKSNNVLSLDKLYLF